MAANSVPDRICTVCQIDHERRVPARYVVRGADGCEWFQCVECVKLDAVHATDRETVTVVGLYEWFRARGLLG